MSQDPSRAPDDVSSRVALYLSHLQVKDAHAMGWFVFKLQSAHPLTRQFVDDLPQHELDSICLGVQVCFGSPQEIAIYVPIHYDAHGYNLSALDEVVQKLIAHLNKRLRDALRVRELINMSKWLAEDDSHE